MAASVKNQWCLAKYAKFVYEYNLNKLNERDDISKTLEVPYKGKWKVYTGEEYNLKLFYLDSDHLLITHNDIILESFSILNSSTWLKGVAKQDSLLILSKLKDGNNRRFRIQFDNEGDENGGCVRRKQCTDLLKKHFPVCDNDSTTNSGSKHAEIAHIDKMLLNKLQYRKAYAVDVSNEHMKEIIMLCLTDTTFPSYVAEVDKILKNIGN